MAIINCPECGKQISSMSNACIHCGFPLKSNNEDYYDVIFNGFVDDKTRVRNQSHASMKIRSLTGLSMIDSSLFLRGNNKITGLTELNANKVKQYFEQCGCIIDLDISSTKDDINNVKVEASFKVDDSPLMCPRCKSTSVTTGKRGYSLLSGFVGSSKVVNRCGKCGYSWEPRR